MRRQRTQFWVESAMAVGTLALLFATLASHDWVETVLRVEPDQGSGAFEWLVVTACLAATIACVLLARREWRRAAA